MDVIEKLVCSFRRVANRSGVMSALRIVRLMALFGPWRPAVRSVIGLARPPQYQEISGSDIFIIGADDQKILVKKIRNNSAARIGEIPDLLLRDIQSITNGLPVGKSQQVHLVVPNIKRRIDDPGLNKLRGTGFH